MSKYLRITIVFIGIWCVASLLNGIGSGVIIAIVDTDSLNMGLGTMALAILFSFVFSVPLVGMLWFFTVMAMCGDKKGNELLQFVLGLALIVAILGALGFIYSIGTEFKQARFFVGVFIIVSALASVLLFRKQIKANE